MRLEVTLPDPLYGELERVSTQTGVSFDRIIREAVQLHLYDVGHKRLTLTDSQTEKVRQTLAEVKAGKFLTLDQMEERQAATRAAWLTESPVSM